MAEIISVIIETPRGSAQKYNYDKKTGFFKLKKILPTGMVFPYDFGFIPQTTGEDGDPLDIMVISEFKSFPGCMMDCRIVGAIKAEQTENNIQVRNDRFIAVSHESKYFKEISSLDDFSKSLLEEIEHFFIAYNEMEGKDFKPIGRLAPDEALKLIKSDQHG